MEKKHQPSFVAINDTFAGRSLFRQSLRLKKASAYIYADAFLQIMLWLTRLM